MHIQKGITAFPSFLLVVLERRNQQFDSLKLFKAIIIFLQEVIISLNKALNIQMNVLYEASTYINKRHCCNDKTPPV